MFRVLRRFSLLLLALLLPLYAISFSESLEIPAAWRAINVGDDHAAVRAQLRESGMQDHQCEWLTARQIVRCTLVGRHHAAGVEIRFDRPGDSARVAAVDIREPVYTGPFHLHARMRRDLR